MYLISFAYFVEGTNVSSVVLTQCAKTASGQVEPLEAIAQSMLSGNIAHTYGIVS